MPKLKVVRGWFGVGYVSFEIEGGALRLKGCFEIEGGVLRLKGCFGVFWDLERVFLKFVRGRCVIGQLFTPLTTLYLIST